MIIQALRYEWNKFGIKKILILSAIIVSLIVMFFAISPKNNSDTYYDNLVEWSASIGNIDNKDLNLSTNQQAIFARYKKIISYKESLLEKCSTSDVNSSYNACSLLEKIKSCHSMLLLLFAVLLAIKSIGWEQSNKEICQSLLMPWKRSSIYIAKLLFAVIVLFFVTLICFGSSYISARLCVGNCEVIPYVFLNDNECSVISFGFYYLLQFLLAIFPALSVYILLSMLLLKIKKISISIIVLVVLVLVFYYFSFAGEYMGYFWYNLFPTKSFQISEYIFSGSIINEIDTFNSQLKYVVNHQFAIIPILIYDFYILFMLICFSVDSIKARDY